MRNHTETWTLQETLVEDLEKLLSLEKAFMMALPMMAQSATHGELQQEFERLSCQTREQIARLQLLVSPAPTNGHMHPANAPEYAQQEGAEASTKDCMLIAETRKKQHAKIALYSTVCLWAHQLGLKDMEHTLAQSLQEEEEDCEKLLRLAQNIMCPIA